MKNHLKVTVLGASGRMGSQIIRRVTESSTMDLHFVVEHKGHNWIGQDCGENLLGRENGVLVTDNLKLALEGAEAVIDFSTPDSSLRCIKICEQTETAHVIGTTGFDLAQENEIFEHSKKVVVVNYPGKKLLNFGAKNVLIKGGHLKTPYIFDIYLSKNENKIFKSKKIRTKNTHGTGCTLSSAIATYFSCGKKLKKSCGMAINYVNHSIENGPKFGKGHGPVSYTHLTLPTKA